MTDQPTLFKVPPPPYDPTKTETHCPLCHRKLKFDKHGTPRHGMGDSRKCEEEERERFANKSASKGGTA